MADIYRSIWVYNNERIHTSLSSTYAGPKNTLNPAERQAEQNICIHEGDATNHAPPAARSIRKNLMKTCLAAGRSLIERRKFFCERISPRTSTKIACSSSSPLHTDTGMKTKAFSDNHQASGCP